MVQWSYLVLLTCPHIAINKAVVSFRLSLYFMLPRIAFKYETFAYTKSSNFGRAEKHKEREKEHFTPPLFLPLHHSQSYTQVYLRMRSVKEPRVHCCSIAFYVPFFISDFELSIKATHLQVARPKCPLAFSSLRQSGKRISIALGYFYLLFSCLFVYWFFVVIWFCSFNSELIKCRFFFYYKSRYPGLWN